jgi:ribA/ribD-fused uncharacterized protein
MMAQKAALFKDERIRDRIMYEDNWSVKSSDPAYAPSVQKALGRLVGNFNSEIWNKYARSIVFIGNYAKFSSIPKLKEKLIRTGNKQLAEASPFDRVWGTGLKKSDPRSLDKSQWLGTNWLGQEIQSVREQLKSEDLGEEYKIDIDSCVKTMFN